MKAKSPVQIIDGSDARQLQSIQDIRKDNLMYRFGIFFLLAGFVLPVFCPADSSVKDNGPTADSKLILVQDGQPSATIVTSSSPTENAQVAAKELQKYIEKISGAKLPIASDSPSVSGCLVLIGRSKLTDEIPGLDIPSGRTKNLREEGFIIRTHGNRLVLAGNDTEPYLGTRYAVIEFLHGLGVRWFMPGEMGEVIPKTSTLIAGPTNITQRPDFPVRDFWEHARGNMASECAEWKIHNKMNPRSHEVFGVPSDGSVSRYLPETLFAEHPDWFALKKDGTRDKDHPCMTSEGMIKHFVERIKAEAQTGRGVTAFAPVDGNPRCWCQNCARIGNGFDGFGANNRDPEPEYSISNEWFYFVNRVLAEVNREFPDHIIATNGYANRDIPPELPPEIPFNPAKNLTIMFANICACTIHAYDDPKCWQMQRQGQMIRQWCKLSDKVWIYNYNYTMLVHKSTITPMVHRIRRNIPLLKEWGVIGFFDQDEADFALTGIPTRLARARLEWDVHTDVNSVLHDFFDKWFGEAAASMEAYYDALENAFEKAPQHGHEDVILRAIYTEPLMSKLEFHIRAAEKAAKSETERTHLHIERVVYDHLCEFVAMEEAKRMCDFAQAASHAGRMVELQGQMNKLSPFMGWHPYSVYDCEWEKKRMEQALAKTHGPEGTLAVILPENARFRTDPFDDGLYERWQDPATDIREWKHTKISSGWDAQGLHDEKGRPYKGIAWYQFDVEAPADVQGKSVILYGLAVVNEAWVWINGQYAGHRPYKMPWFRPQQIELDVSSLLKPGQNNRITVRVLCNFDVFGANGIYEPMFLYTRPLSKPVSSQ